MLHTFICSLLERICALYFPEDAETLQKGWVYTVADRRRGNLTRGVQRTVNLCNLLFVHGVLCFKLDNVRLSNFLQGRRRNCGNRTERGHLAVE